MRKEPIIKKKSNRYINKSNKNKDYSRFDWRTIFLKNSGGISSKRVIAIFGVLICFGLLIAGFIMEKTIPDFAEIVFIGCLSLYGVEMLPVWNKSKSDEI